MKKLPLVKTDIMESSEYHRFYLGVLLQNRSYLEEIYNKQIGLMYNKDTRVLSSPLDNAYNWYQDTALEIEGFLLGKSWDVIGGKSPDVLPNLIMEKLYDDYYVKYTGDLFYIKSKPEYGIKHFWSNIYLIGIDDENFIAVGRTKNDSFEEYVISSDEMISSVKKRNGVDIYNKYTYSFELDFYKLKNNLSFSINKDKIKNQLLKYLNPIKREKYWLGIDVYPVIISEWKENVINSDQLFFIRDHINLMYKRIIALNYIIDIPEYLIDDYYHLDEKITKLLKYSSIYNKDRIIAIFKDLVIEEKTILSTLIKII